MSMLSLNELRRLPVAAVLPVLLLAGCSGGPSGSDVEKAVQQNMADTGTQLPGASNFMPRIHEVKKLACKETSGVVYQCDVELDMTPPMGARRKTVTQMNLAKGSDGWTLTR